MLYNINKYIKMYQIMPCHSIGLWLKHLSVLCGILVLTACADDPKSLLSEAKDKISNSTFISYRYTSLWPNPVGKVDTTEGISTFNKNANDYFDYNYVSSNGKSDVVYIDNDFKQVNHRDSIVFIYSKEDQEKKQNFISGNVPVDNSPIMLLNQPSWEYTKDTLIHEITLHGYRQVEMDTIIEGKEIYVEKHIFINPSSALLERFERRAFLNGKSSQTIVYTYSEYAFDQNHEPLEYAFPENYKSQMFGNREKIKELEAGQKAPNFEMKDIEGNQISLESLRGKKVLLDFSVINCGYCKRALEHFNQEGYQMTEEISGVYINPMDNKSDVLDYVSNIAIPFPVIAEAKDVGKSYGVSGFPTFFLIDEQGIIEKVVIGYDKAFVAGLSGS